MVQFASFSRFLEIPRLGLILRISVRNFLWGEFNVEEFQSLLKEDGNDDSFEHEVNLSAGLETCRGREVAETGFCEIHGGERRMHFNQLA